MRWISRWKSESTSGDERAETKAVVSVGWLGLMRLLEHVKAGVGQIARVPSGPVPQLRASCTTFPCRTSSSRHPFPNIPLRQGIALYLVPNTCPPPHNKHKLLATRAPESLPISNRVHCSDAVLDSFISSFTPGSG